MARRAQANIGQGQKKEKGRNTGSAHGRENGRTDVRAVRQMARDGRSARSSVASFVRNVWIFAPPDGVQLYFSGRENVRRSAREIRQSCASCSRDQSTDRTSAPRAKFGKSIPSRALGFKEQRQPCRTSRTCIKCCVTLVTASCGIWYKRVVLGDPHWKLATETIWNLWKIKAESGCSNNEECE